MRILDFLQHSVSPWGRCIACTVLGGALFLLYRWDPERRKEKQQSDSPYGEIPVEPPVSESAWRALSGDGIGRPKRENATHSTVVELERYLEDLRRHRIASVDRV